MPNNFNPGPSPYQQFKDWFKGYFPTLSTTPAQANAPYSTAYNQSPGMSPLQSFENIPYVEGLTTTPAQANVPYSPQYYQIRPDDTFDTIGEQFGVSPAAIQEMNGV